MASYNFKLASAYTGQWKVNGNDAEFHGTLTFSEDRIVLDLQSKCHLYDYLALYCISGKAYPHSDSKTKNSKLLWFFIHDARIISSTTFFADINHIVLEVGSVSFSENEIHNVSTNNNIRKCIVRSKTLDKWLLDVFLEKYDDNDNFLNPERDDITVNYTNPSSICLCNNENFEAKISFGYSTGTPDSEGFHIMHKSFLCITFKHEVSRNEATSTVEKFIHFFMLIWNYTFEPDFVEYIEEDNRYFWKKSNENGLANYRKHKPTFRIDYSELKKPDLRNLLEKWILLYFDEKYAFALSEYFDTIYNENSMPSSRLRNYVSVIDGLSKYYESSLPSITVSQKEQRLNDIVSQCQPYIRKDDFNFLKTQLTKKREHSITERFEAMLKDTTAMHQFVPDNFVPLIIDSRNGFTHTDPDKKIIPHEKLSSANLLLENIIRAYLLLQLGMPNDLIKKAVYLFGEFKLLDA